MGRCFLNTRSVYQVFHGTVLWRFICKVIRGTNLYLSVLMKEVFQYVWDWKSIYQPILEKRCICEECWVDYSKSFKVIKHISFYFKDFFSLQFSTCSCFGCHAIFLNDFFWQRVFGFCSGCHEDFCLRNVLLILACDVTTKKKRGSFFSEMFNSMVLVSGHLCALVKRISVSRVPDFF